MKYFIILLISLLCSSIAIAFPETVRYGNPTCITCHVSPSGGGALTGYGRSSGAKINTWEFPGLEEPLLGLYQLPDEVLIGGDIRTMHIVQTEPINRYRAFLMQADLELGYELSNEVTIAGAIGFYDREFPINLAQYIEPVGSRFYLLNKPKDWLTIKIGKFKPVFGLSNPNHKVVTTNLLNLAVNEGVYSLELGFLSSYFDSFFTISEINGEKALITKTSIYINNKNKVGFSYGYNQHTNNFGVFTIFGVGRFFTMVFDSRIDSHGVDKRYFIEFQAKPFKGVAVKTRLENMEAYKQKLQKIVYGVQWFPISHVELLTEYSKGYFLFMSHYYF